MTASQPSRVELHGQTLDVTFLNDRIVRVRYGSVGCAMPVGGALLDREHEPVAVERRETGNFLELRGSKVGLRLDRETGAIEWLDVQGNLLLREGPRTLASLTPVPVMKPVVASDAERRMEKTVDGEKATVEVQRLVEDRQAFQARLDLEFQEGEAVYGLGSHEEGILNYRGRMQYLYQQNMKVAVPVFVSTRGYGVFVNTESLSVFHDDQYGSYFWTEFVDCLEYYFIAGPSFDEIVGGLRYLTGDAPLFPRWLYGYAQSKERYESQAELVEVVDEYRRRNIPLDVIIQDWRSWTGELWGQKSFDPERFPDPDGMMRDLHERNSRLLISIWPIMHNNGPNHVEMREKGFLLANDATYDAFDADARALYWKHANDGLFVHGVDGWWCDCTEPFEKDWRGTAKPEPWKRVEINTGEAKKYLDPAHINTYSLHHSAGLYEGQRSVTKEKRVVNLTRSGFPGQQRYGTITWSGDIIGLWEVLKSQIAEGLNFCVTGQPYWTFDIGGFFVKPEERWFWHGKYPRGCEDPAYRELYTRWLQAGTFLPMMRSHGTDTPREVWRFGEPGEPYYDAIVRFIELRYRLLPYIYSLAGWVTHRSYTMLRLLAFDFRDDPNVFDVDDQFMFGPSLMVCPVTEPLPDRLSTSPMEPVYETRTVYLPKHEGGWFDFWTGERLDGGQCIEAPAPLDRIPIFVPAGSVLPMGPVVQHTGEQPNAPIEWRVYPGRNGEFTLYDDGGDGYDYEQGAFAEVPVRWDDEAKVLTVGPLRGGYEGMPPKRTMRAVRVAPGCGLGDSIGGAPGGETIFEGSKIELPLG